MADPVVKTPVTMELVSTEAAVPAPDMLIVGPKGAVHTDVVKVAAEGTFQRGTLLMAGADGYVPATAAGLSTASDFAILADDATVGENEYIETAAYFEGDFNEDAVIFPWETDSDDHAEIVEAAREPLRKAKIFLRKVQG